MKYLYFKDNFSLRSGTNFKGEINLSVLPVSTIIDDNCKDTILITAENIILVEGSSSKIITIKNPSIVEYFSIDSEKRNMLDQKYDNISFYLDNKDLSKYYISDDMEECDLTTL